jgi:hypothetical protein
MCASGLFVAKIPLPYLYSFTAALFSRSVAVTPKPRSQFVNGQSSITVVKREGGRKLS